MCDKQDIQGAASPGSRCMRFGPLVDARRVTGASSARMPRMPRHRDLARTVEQVFARPSWFGSHPMERHADREVRRTEQWPSSRSTRRQHCGASGPASILVELRLVSKTGNCKFGPSHRSWRPLGFSKS